MHIRARGMRFGVLDIDLAVEFELDVVGSLFRLRAASEGQAGGFEID